MVVPLMTLYFFPKFAYESNRVGNYSTFW
jgi:hypothetical protein